MLRLFTFETDQPGEIALRKDELVEVVSQDDGGELPQICSVAFCTSLTRIRMYQAGG
jgi:hypothetical protein